MLLSIKNNGPGLLMIDTIEVIVDCRDSLKSHKADFVSPSSSSAGYVEAFRCVLFGQAGKYLVELFKNGYTSTLNNN